MNTTSSILVPVDFSEQSIIGLEQSYNLAKFSKSMLILLHVIKMNKTIWDFLGNKEQISFRKKICAKLSDLGKQVSKSQDIPVKHLVKMGKLVDNILQVSAKYNTDYIVMGTTPSDNITKKIIGYNALRVVKESKCPVITIKGKHHKNGCENIILPLDLTRETRQKVTNAIDFAKLFHAKIQAISMISTSDTRQVQKLGLLMQQVCRYIARNGVDCHTDEIKVSGNDEKIAKKLIEYSHQKDGDLIVVMTQQETEITDFFLGSPAQELIYHSDIPVLSIVPRLKYNYDSVVF
ncbi:MAG: universal stress protein [Bacteroidia bacterium]|nr:universal stress protein [Bacteroidia bacterium]